MVGVAKVIGASPKLFQHLKNGTAALLPGAAPEQKVSTVTTHYTLSHYNTIQNNNNEKLYPKPDIHYATHGVAELSAHLDGDPEAYDLQILNPT